MSMLTLAKTVIGGTIAGLTLLALTANPSLADTHNQTASPTTASSSTNEAPVAQERLSQTIAQTNQAPQQPTQGGCSCCKNMMNNMNMPAMRNNMPGMTGNQSNPSR